ncbi:MAG TPA: UvrD-helicase domain-containing protein [Solirubrobacteraceae bacterium]|jgi:ATP-dependent exoDNAse (exonuclease V) beta subunit|nr:UvrD-helicase domain-containing protein [Solirubrobacteraceae bacterium]
MSEPARELTDEQERAASRRQGSLLLAAGAGSGKTAVLVERFARAVVEDRIAPGRILAITFTERAAGELRERLRARLLELGERELARQAEAAFVSTFHGFCARMLRAHPLQAGIEPSFRVLDETFATRLQRRAFASALAGFLAGEREPAVELAGAYGADPLRGMVLGAYAQLRSQGQIPPRLLVGPDLPVPVGPNMEEAELGDDVDAALERQALAVCAFIDELLERFGRQYEGLKRERAALDFDDLELLARELLGRRSLREAWSQRFELLMVDEFQDSNQRQLQILAALDRDNLFTVGDELQSIYGFRHADVRLFRERGEHLAEREAALALTRNFRSRPPILVAVKRMFSERMGRRFAGLLATRENAPAVGPAVELLLADRNGSERTGPRHAPSTLPDAAPWRQAEAALLARRIHELIEQEGVAAGEIVVLLRALGDLPVYEAALRARSIATVAAVGGFWSHQQVADMLAWLRALANPLDELALYSVLASPLVGLSSDGMALLASFAHERGAGVWQSLERSGDELGALLAPADRDRLARFRRTFTAERRELALRPIAALLRRALAASDYERHVLALDWGERRLASVHKLLRLARSYEAQEGRDLRGFLDHVAHVEEALGGREPDALAAEQPDAVCLMSIHAAKGLEFPVVCVADLGREPNLRQGDLLVDADGRVGLRLLSLEHPEAAATLAYEELREELRQTQEEEEDRILYVACTRARERLILSGAVPFARWPQPRVGSAPIAWLAPALVPDVLELAAAAEPGETVTVELEDGLAVRCVFGDDVADARNSESGGWEADRRAAPDALRASGSSPGAEPIVAPEPVAARAATPAHFVPEATVSYTSLAELERCGYRYYLERVLHLAERRELARADGGGLDARLRGTIAHALLERVDFGRPRPPGEDDVRAVARRLGVRVPPAAAREIVQLLAGALASAPADRLGAAGSGRREHPFSFSLGPEQPLIGGVLDLYVELPEGGALIVDYKSDRLAVGEDLERIVQRDYAIQRLVYALAALQGGATHVEVAHWFLERPEQWVAASFSADEREGLLEQLRERLQAARRQGFAVSAQPHRELCLTCPGRGGLCSWGETHTMRARATTLAISR